MPSAAEHYRLSAKPNNSWLGVGVQSLLELTAPRKPILPVYTHAGADYVDLYYRTEGEDQAQRVKLVLGEERNPRSVRCPQCEARRQTLYFRRGCFACRQCQGLYDNPGPPAKRVLRAVEAIREKLGWAPGMASGEGYRPAQMDQREFEALQQEHDELVARYILMTAAER